MIGSLMYLTASRPDIMYAVCVCSRFQVTPKTSHLNAVKRIFKYLKGKPNLGLWYPRDSPLDLEAFSDSDYGGSNLDRKSTTGGCQFLGQRLISWQCKKQTIVATSTTEAEYVAAANCCGQVLWVQNQLLDYGFNFMNTKIHIDNESTICIVKNPVYHSKTKHIEIRHHFIRDCYEKKLISVEKIHTDLNVADLLTKPFDGPRFNYLVVSIVRFNPGSSVKVRFNPGSSKLKLILVLLGVEKGDARSTWTWKRKCQLSLANWMQFGCKYALTHNPPIYDSLVKQFWQTATARTLEDGIQQLNATIDSIEYTITEESVRRQLQLADASGINMLQNEEIFVGLQNIGSKSGGWDQFGSNIATALICLSTGRDFNFSKLIFDGMISNLKSKSKFLMYPRFLQMILNVQTENKNLFVPVSLTKKIFGNMKRGFQGIHRPLLPVMLTIDAGQPQPSADPTPSQSVPATSSSHVQITQPPPTLTHSVQPPPQPSSVQPTATTPPTQPVQTTSPPPSKSSGEAQEEQISPSTLEAAQILTNVASEGFKGSQAPLGSKIYKRKSNFKLITGEVNAAEVNTPCLISKHQRPSIKKLQEIADLEEAKRVQSSIDEKHKDKLILMHFWLDDLSDSLAEKIQQERREAINYLGKEQSFTYTIAAQRKEKEHQKENEKDAIKRRKERMKSVHEEVQEEEEQRKEGYAQRKLKAKRESKALVSQEKMMI
ncbi:hypothetical protein Tco_0718510 [Tanacetum coccineum]